MHYMLSFWFKFNTTSCLTVNFCEELLTSEEISLVSAYISSYNYDIAIEKPWIVVQRSAIDFKTTFAISSGTL